MKLSKVIILFVLLVNFGTYSFAEIKTFSKEDEEIVPTYQSRDQVIAYLTQKLTREAIEEAGLFVKSELKIESGQITKEEITNITGSIASIKVEDSKTRTINNEQYVKVKVNIKVDTDTVKTFLDKIKQDSAYKDEAEALRKKNAELEKRLKTANRQQYEQILSKEAEYQVQIQKRRSIEYNKMALKAKEEYANVEKKQKEEDLKRQQELKKLQDQMERENAKMQLRIAQEQDELKKAELENKALIKQLENTAQIESFKTALTNKTSIQQINKEVDRILNEIKNIKMTFKNSLQQKEIKLKTSYNEAINSVNQYNFNQNKPVKESWDTEGEYQTKLNKYLLNKQEYDNSVNAKINDLTTRRDNAIKENRELHRKSYNNSVAPFIKQLKDMQKGRYYENNTKVHINPIEEINADEEYFILEVKYKGVLYNLPFYFSNIGKQKAKAMAQTMNQFKVEPMFSFEIINGKFKQHIVAFQVIHYGTKEERIIPLHIWFNNVDEKDKFFSFDYE